MLPTLPIHSLKRDEIYTFLGGLFIALVWGIYLMLSCSLFVRLKELSPIFYIIFFLFLWLLATLLIFIIYQYLAFFILFLSPKVFNFFPLSWVKWFMGIKEEPHEFHFNEFYEETVLRFHISMVLIISLLLNYFPFSKVHVVFELNKYIEFFNLFLIFFIIIIPIFLFELVRLLGLWKLKGTENIVLLGQHAYLNQIGMKWGEFNYNIYLNRKYHFPKQNPQFDFTNWRFIEFLRRKNKK